MLKHSDVENFEKDVLTSEKVTLVDFFATWCGPCKMLGPILEEIAKERDDFDIVKVDIDDNKDLAYKYEIEVVPTMIILKNGEVMQEVEGLYDKEDIIKMISKYL